MRYLLYIFFATMLFACSAVSAPPDDVPGTFQQGNDNGSFGKKYGGREDVVNAMYNEVLDDNAGLKTLEKDIRDVPGNVSDASAAYNSFVYNNSSYYNSAMRHVNSITDTALKARIRTLVEASSHQYQRSVSKHNTLINEINWKQATLSDLHTYLKLVKTLPVIEAYQKKNLPDTKPLENVSVEIDKITERTKDATRNN